MAMLEAFAYDPLISWRLLDATKPAEEVETAPDPATMEIGNSVTARLDGIIKEGLVSQADGDSRRVRQIHQPSCEGVDGHINARYVGRQTTFCVDVCVALNCVLYLFMC